VTEQFKVLREDHGSFRLLGELDLATAGHLLALLPEMTTDGAGPLELDLSDLEFIDSAGVRAIVSIALETGSRQVILKSPRGEVLRVLDLVRVNAWPTVVVERAASDAPARSHAT
jgi:anti-anti-sigma factor